MEKPKTLSTKKLILLAIALIMLAAAAAAVYFLTRPDAVAGSKEVTLEITYIDGTSETIVLKTDAEYLLDAMQEREGLVDGYRSEFGYTITTVNGHFADAAKNEWWVYTLDGNWVDTAADATPILDGQHYEFSIYK